MQLFLVNRTAGQEEYNGLAEQQHDREVVDGLEAVTQLGKRRSHNGFNVDKVSRQKVKKKNTPVKLG